MANKRKRDDSNGSDSEEITPGRQILPVANLPCDFDQEPLDGMQYLFLVRRDARRLPHVTRVRNPYEVSETKATPALTPIFVNVLPCEEWRIAFQTHFSNLRKNLAQATIHVDLNRPGSGRKVIPERKDRDAWWKFLAGHPESVWSPRVRSIRKKRTIGRLRAFADPAEIAHPRDVRSLPDAQSRNEPSCLPIPCFYDVLQNAPQQPNSLRTGESTDLAPSAADPLALSEEVGEECVERLSPLEVTPSHLREIDHRMSIHLLMYFTHWINVHLQNPNDPLTTISLSHGRWIFALLIKIEDQLTADEMNLLRNLARACLGIIQMRKGKDVKNDGALQTISGRAVIEDTVNMSDASCWMIFAAIAGYWGQRDLWADAETTLTSV